MIIYFSTLPVNRHFISIGRHENEKPLSFKFLYTVRTLVNSFIYRQVKQFVFSADLRDALQNIGSNNSAYLILKSISSVIWHGESTQRGFLKITSKLLRIWGSLTLENLEFTPVYISLADPAKHNLWSISYYDRQIRFTLQVVNGTSCI